MHDDEVPADIRALLHEHICSYEELEILLLLRSHGREQWTEEGLSNHLRVPASVIAPALERLRSAGLVQVSAHGAGMGFAYAARTPELDSTVGRLACEYRERPIQIIRLMNENALERVRTAAKRTFADAFVLRKDKPRG